MVAIVRLPGAKRPFIAGLKWLSFESLPSADGIRKLSAAYGRWVAVRRDASQIGFCDPLADVRAASSVVSLAATVAGSKSGPWRGIYRVGQDLWWYIAVGPGEQVLPDGDVVSDLPTLRRLWDAQGSLASWNLEVDGTPEDLLDTVNASAIAPTISLRDLGGTPWFLRPPAIAAAALVVILSCGGYWTWQHHVSAALRARAMAALKLKRTPKKVLPPPWVGQVSPSDGFMACGAAWDGRQRLARDGWVLSGWNCRVSAGRGSVVNSSWVRMGGVADDAPGTTRDGEHSVLTEPIGTILPIARSGAVGLRDQVLRALWTDGQKWGVRVIVARSKSRGLRRASPHGAAKPNWGSLAFELAMPMAPWLYPPGAFDIPGARVSRVETTVSRNEWIVNGTLYFKGH